MGCALIRAAAAALLLLCALVDPVAGMKLPLTKGRFGALKKLLVYVGSVDRTTNVEQWSELSSVPGLIDRASAGDGDGDGCVPVSTDCCPQVELPEDEDDDDDDL